MKNLFKRWREVPEKAESFVGVETRALPEAVPWTPVVVINREKPVYEGVESLEGEDWSVHSANGTVYLSGENGAVQAQFAPVDAFSLGALLQRYAQD